MSNKRVLLVSYYFPPLGGAGIARPFNLFKYLNQFGYDCDVLTVKPVLYRAYEPELMNDLDESRIYRSGTYEPSRLMYLLGIRSVSTGTADKSRVVSNRIFPDGKAGWIGPAVRFGSTLCVNKKYDLIVSTSPPVSAHVIAMRLAKKFKVPWVADFQDFWVSLKAEEHFISASKVARARELLGEIRTNAKKIIAVNKSCAEYVSADTTIPICYDSSLAKQWQQLEKNESFNIGLFGTLSDLTPVEPLLKVLDIVRRSDKSVFENIKLFHLGLVEKEWLVEQLNRYQMRDKFELLEYQPRDEMIATLSRASLFYFGINQEQGKGIVPSRLFTLLSSGRPVMAYASAQSEVDSIITKCLGCQRFDDDSIEQAAEFLTERIKSGNSGFTIEPEYARGYSSERMVERFAEVFDGIC